MDYILNKGKKAKESGENGERNGRIPIEREKEKRKKRRKKKSTKSGPFGGREKIMRMFGYKTVGKLLGNNFTWDRSISYEVPTTFSLSLSSPSTSFE